ncbi:F-box associated domain, type 1 [Artemisia annua]|uniref:F-box associated domain, type 1 n=1 Tax=Artemisia annua TaxID=35608 RepID=A0A2U1MJK9_ARTAN|nr:F-box associated domain, type 1 [Artemisia annua]
MKKGRQFQPTSPPPALHRDQPNPGPRHSPPTSHRDLPFEVVQSILLKLDIKTLLRSKISCKSWWGGISEAYFRNQYLSPKDGILTVAGFEPDLTDASDIVSDSTWIMPQRNVEWIEIEDNTDHHIVHDGVALLEMDRFRLFRSTYPIPIHSENGLVLFVDEHNARHAFLFICNPITKECMTFPTPPPAAPRPPDHSIFSSNYPNGYGFGRNIEDGAYRVLMICGPQAAVYTLGSGQWVINTQNMRCTLYESTGITVGNGIHWLIRAVEMEDKDGKENEFEMENEVDTADGDEAEAEARVLRICRFDLNSQTFELMECIGVHPRPDDGDPMLGVLNKNLCICFSTRRDDAEDNEESHLSVWVMTESDGIRAWRLYIHVQGEQWIEGSMIKSLADGDHVMIGSSVNLVRGSGCAHWTGAIRKILVYNTPTNSFVSEWRLNRNMMGGVCYRPSLFSIKHNFEAESERVFHLS